MNYATEIKGDIDIQTFAEKARLILGLVMMFAGLYFGVSSDGAGEGLGLLTFLVSPFVMVTDRKG